MQKNVEQFIYKPQIVQKKIKFNTPVQQEKTANYEYDTVISGIGSCFADNLLNSLYDSGFSGMNNPTGIVYNSASIKTAIEYSCNQKQWTDKNFFKHNSLWHSWDHHGSFSSPDLNKAVIHANEVMEAFTNTLKKCGLFVMTPSSSVVYALKDSGRITANCHKVPQTKFERKLLSVNDNYAYLTQCVNLINKFNPSCKIIFTLSPVRHYPGDPVLNARSKAVLLSAIHQCIDKHQDCCSYFPAYEILNDELRDYRFYAEDMVHPSELTRKIIRSRFLDAFFSPTAIEQIIASEKQQKAAGHRPLHQ